MLFSPCFLITFQRLMWADKKWVDIAAACILYAMVLVYQGYQYGQGDQSQILPCLYAQDHPDTYAQDHYVSHYLDSGVNERTIFHFLLRYLGYNQPWIVWLWHAALSISLMLAWIRITALGIRQKAYQWLAPVLIFIVGFHTSMGSNDIYYNSLIPSLAAKSVGSWALYYWLKERYLLWSMGLIIAGYLQPLVGLQLFLLTSLSLSLDLAIKKQLKEWPGKEIGLYLLLTIPWIYLLARNNGGHTDPKAFMDIMEFRLSHHFFAGYFGWMNLAAGFAFAIIALRSYKLKLRWLVMVIIAGCILYEIGVEVYRLPLPLYTQWWKTTIWLEALAFIAIMAGIEKLIPAPKWLTKFQPGLLLIIFILVCIYRLSGVFGQKPDYMFPWSSTKSAEVDISIKSEQSTPKDAVFIIPVEFSAFRWYAKRSTYVDYKAMIHQEAFLKDWYKRMQNIYAYGLPEKKIGFDLHAFSRDLLEEPSLISIQYWKTLGITHIISTAAALKDMELIDHNDSYYIYRLK